MTSKASGLRSRLERILFRAARPYIAGPALDDAVRVCNRLSESGARATLGYWNRPGEDVALVEGEYSSALAHALMREPDPPYLSIKAPALGFRPGLVMQVARTAASRSIRLHFDSHGPEAADEIFSLAHAAQALHPAVGCTLPARWSRSDLDAERVARQGLYVRVVKGQWPGDEGDDRDARLGFLEVVARLAGRARHVAVATHDHRLAPRALEMLLGAGTRCELELLYGLPRRAVLAARPDGVGIRFYVPYGTAFLPYSLGRLNRSPRLAWWLLKDLARGSGERLRRG